MDYEEIDALSQEEAKRNLSNKDSRIVVITLLSIALHEPDRDWTEKQCLEHLKHSNDRIKYAAILSIAHIARIDRQFNKCVIPFFREYIKNPELSGRVQDAIDDICMFTDTEESIFR
ncbi:hypothetical protein IQ249_15845 [Lusitaniella coriacea LEGE 07157]|uniref:Uncharacterized protein n=1 Tax=Lusitaniella coriacea LEGE 07157 TaxID=945747 RepID=A0A8J7DY44_9CYAN|nr:hypothetical protein [Lusitaniella coriacea]MBE9117372.1 hypothetical protein [Lusitaniella coriacea LEGE 07157]